MAAINISNQQMQPDFMDPITKFKLLVPRLKDALQKVMNQAAQVLSQNAVIDNCTARNADIPIQKFDRSLEDFYAICDQIEINLRLGIEVISQNSDAQRYGPVATPQVNPDSGAFQQYVNQVRLQLSSAKELHDMLVDCARKITEKPLQPPSS